MAKFFYQVFSTLILFYCTGVWAQDPCNATNHMVLSCETWRTSANVSTPASFVCDTRFPSGWVRFDSPSGNTMLENVCPSLLSCGTVFPVWLNGTHPSVADGIVTRTACANVYGICCQRSYTVSIKNCSNGYMVYNMPRVANCLGYCIGQEEPCPVNTSSPTGYTPNCVANYTHPGTLPCVTTTTTTTTTSATTSPTTSTDKPDESDSEALGTTGKILIATGIVGLLAAGGIAAGAVVYHKRRNRPNLSEKTTRVHSAQGSNENDAPETNPSESKGEKQANN